MSVNRVYVEDLINTYFEMGISALERREYSIAQKMFKAVFDEPSSKAQKEKIMLPLLIRSGEAHEGLKQLYKAKLLYIRALALQKKMSQKPDMQSVDLLLRLAHLTAQQGLYRQAVDFAIEAYQDYRRCCKQDPIEFVRKLRSTERIMQMKGRITEQEKLLGILQGVRSEALLSIPNVSIAPVAISI